MSKDRLAALRAKVKVTRQEPPPHRVKTESKGRYRVEVKTGHRYQEWGWVERSGSTWCSTLAKEGFSSRDHRSKGDGVEALMAAYPDGHGYPKKPIEQPEPEPEPVTATVEVSNREDRAKNFPVLLACGHFDWDYDEVTDTCGLCRKKQYAYPSNSVRGVLIQLVHEVERLSNEVSPVLMEGLSHDNEDIEESAQRLYRRVYRLKNLSARGAKLVSARETFEAYPGHVAIRDQHEQAEAAEAARAAEGDGEGADPPPS